MKNPFSALSVTEFGLVCRTILENAGYRPESTRLHEKTVVLKMSKNGRTSIIRCYHYDVVNQIDYTDTAIAITGGSFSGMVRIFAEGSGIRLMDGRELSALLKGKHPKDVCNAHTYTMREVYAGYSFQDDSYHQYRSRVRDLNNQYSPQLCRRTLCIHWNHLTEPHAATLPEGVRLAIRKDAGKCCAKGIRKEENALLFFSLYDIQFELLTGSYRHAKEGLSDVLLHYTPGCDEFLRCMLHNLLQLALMRGDYPYVLWLKDKLTGIDFNQKYDRLLYLLDENDGFSGYPIRSSSAGIRLFLPDGTPSVFLSSLP